MITRYVFYWSNALFLKFKMYEQKPLYKTYFREAVLYYD